MANELFGKKISGIFATVSGILTTRPSILELIAKEVPEIGVLTTKSIGIEPWKGNIEPIICERGVGCYGNAVGLRNPGYKKFKQEMLGMYAGNRGLFNDKFVLVSIF